MENVVDDDTIVRIGDPISDPPPAVFELVVNDYVSLVDPRDYGLDRKGINPLDYFITSGDAVQKAIVLDHDLWQLAGSLRSEILTAIATENNCSKSDAYNLFRNGMCLKEQPGLIAYEAAVWRAAGQGRKLLSALKLAKGSNCFLETEWNSHRLLCIPKNPRKGTNE